MEIPITQQIIDKLKTLINDFDSIVDIRPTDNIEEYDVDYIAITYWKNTAPEFRYNTQKRLNLKSEMRDMKIDILLNSDPEPEFDVESLIYTPSQLERIKHLRITAEPRVHGWSALQKIKKEYSENFRVGQKVFYQEQKAIISFKHEYKDGVAQRWSVKVKDTEFRRVYGYELLARVSKDLTHIPVDKDLDKLSTEKLLKMYRKILKLHKGLANDKIKRILQDRENIQKGETKIIEVR